MSQARPEVVIVGGGFGGLYAARALKGAPAHVTIVDRRNHHLFQPLLYQVATAALNPADIAAPIRSVFRGWPNVSVLLAEAVAVDVAAKKLVLADGELPYDYLVLATGATHSYFGHDEWAPFAPGLKSIEDALEIRRRVLLAYETAERERDPERRREWMTFVIIGGGPTGVELAGALAEISRQALSREFQHIDPSHARIILIEGVSRVLPPYPEELSAKARRQLERLGVDVWTGARVTGVDEGGVHLGAERIRARTVIWAAGVAASPLARTLGVSLDRAGRVLVGPTLTIPGRDDVFVIGDLAAVEQDGKPVPGVAPAAIQMGRHVARNIRLALAGRPGRPFRYRHKGSFATIGRGKAVGELVGGLRLSGFPAWVAWLAIHIVFLIGFRNRVLVIFQWAYSYVTFRRGARLITGAPPPRVR
ncbi:MAG TPA: NAD(P)/FAD-dependent oxidoreductase [Methylomirabilota bacterium]|jgi:NADH dehydrogenase